MSSLKSYLANLEARLGGLPPDALQAVMEELRGHLEDRAASAAGRVAGRRRASLFGNDVGRGVRRLLAMAGEPRPGRTALDPVGGRRGNTGLRPGGGAGGPKAAAAEGVGNVKEAIL